ncbi:MAG: hypothetical protein JW869_01055 [Candidatus Omnitrophica bacterium]|nr:hypothetical protein [Candidatus Omnitrophota bacterium]
MAEIKKEDLEHLRLLSIFHYVIAILAGLFSCIFIIHLIIGIVAIVSPETLKDEAGKTPPAFFGWIFAVIGAAAILMGWTFAICLIVAGRFLVRHKHYLFCLIMACLSCLFVPLGTLLGVFTIVVLMRPEVKELFGHQDKHSTQDYRIKQEGLS